MLSFARARLSAAVGGLSPTYWLLWGGMLLNKLGNFALPFLSLYLTQQRGLGADAVGAVVALYGLGALVSSQVGGMLADRLGRKATILLSLWSTSLALLVLGTATEPLTLAGATLLFGLVADMYRPAVSAVIADVVPPPQRLRAFALLYWAINLGFAVAPVIAGLLAREHFFALFVAEATTTFLYGLLVAWRLPETRPALPEGQVAEAPLAAALAPFRDRVFLAFLGPSLLCALIFLQMQVPLPLDMTAKGLTARDYGLAIGVNGALIVLVQPFVAGRLSRFRRAHVLAVGTLLVGLGFGLNAFAHTLPAFALCVAVWTVGEIIISPTNSSIVADLAPTHARGRYQGAFNFTWSGAHMLAPLLGGWALGRFGSSALWATCLMVGLTSALFHLAIAPMRRQRLAAVVQGAGD